MFILEDHGLSLVSTNATAKTIVEDLIDNDFINFWKQNNNCSDVYETDVIEFYMSKDSISDKQYELLKRYYKYYNEQRCPECDEVILSTESNAVNAIVKKMESHINVYAKEYLLSEIMFVLGLSK